MDLVFIVLSEYHGLNCYIAEHIIVPYQNAIMLCICNTPNSKMSSWTLLLKYCAGEILTRGCCTGEVIEVTFTLGAHLRMLT
jgi:hypothetical protein